jgi:mannose-6-phosphate isomerase
MKNVVRLYPECKDNIWGGVSLREKYGKITDKNPIGESWELSFHPDGPTKLEDGATLQSVVTEQELGENCKGFPFFPMLIKFIDAKDDLSVQVHPSDDYALANENSFGKTEMWYVVEAEEGWIRLGDKALTEEKSGELLDELNEQYQISVKYGKIHLCQ